MSNFIKYYTNPTFNKPEFVRVLRYSMNVKAAAVDDGIILDLDAFNAISKAVMPHWAFINARYINSKLYTRPASLDEYKAALDKDTTEQLYIIRDNYYNEYDRVTAKEWDRLNAEIPGRYDLLGKEPAV